MDKVFKVQLADQDSENFLPNFLLGTHFEKSVGIFRNLRIRPDFAEFFGLLVCRMSSGLVLSDTNQS